MENQAQLEMIVSANGLSENVYEIALKSLAQNLYFFIKNQSGNHINMNYNNGKWQERE